MTSHSFSFQIIFNTPFADRNGGGETLERQKYYEKMYIEHSVTSFLYSHLPDDSHLGITFLFFTGKWIGMFVLYDLVLI